MAVVKRRGRPKKEAGKKLIRVYVRLDEDDYKCLMKVCERTGLSVSEAIRQCIRLRHSVL